MTSASSLTRVDRVPKKTHKKFIEAWNAGVTRQRLADEFYLSVKGIDSLRVRLKLPPRVKPPFTLSEDVGKIDDDRQIETPIDTTVDAKRERKLAGNAPLPPFHPIALDVLSQSKAFMDAKILEWEKNDKD